MYNLNLFNINIVSEPLQIFEVILDMALIESQIHNLQICNHPCIYSTLTSHHFFAAYL